MTPNLKNVQKDGNFLDKMYYWLLGCVDAKPNKETKTDYGLVPAAAIVLMTVLEITLSIRTLRSA